MFHLGLVSIIVAEREREIETNIRRRRLMQPEDTATEASPPARRSGGSRSLEVRVRPTGG
jgi:hypothetical protein